MEKILVIGALGQLGTELAPELRRIFGDNNVFTTDVHSPGQMAFLKTSRYWT